MKIVIAIAIVLIGVAGGVAAGIMLKPVGSVDEVATAALQKPAEPEITAPDPDRAFVELRPQTIIPVVDGGRTKALMLFELAIDVPSALVEDVHSIQPRLRDAFLSALLRLAQAGSFDDNFTDDRIIAEMRSTLTARARDLIGKDDARVLILDVMRQEQ